MLTYQKNSLHKKGFTLIELLVTLALIGIVTSIGIPNFTQTIKNSRLTTNINTLVGSLNFARSEAIKRGMRVVVRKAGAQWENGWTVFTDLGADGVMTAGTDILLRSYAALPSNFTLRGTTPAFTNAVSYQNTGISASGSFVLCENSDGDNTPDPYDSKLVVINSLGRIQIGMDTDSNGIPEKSSGTEIISCTVSPFT